MGTNYYLESADERVHVTKTSGGWEPSLHWYRGDHFTSIEELREMVHSPEWSVVDEYGNTWSPRLFWEKLTRWKEENGRRDSGDDWREWFVRDGWVFIGGSWC